MTQKQKALNYIRTHAEPFTIQILSEATKVSEETCHKHVSEFMADGLIRFAGPREHLPVSPGKPFGNWKPREYKAT